MSSSSCVILRSILRHKDMFRKSISIAWKYLPLYNRLCMCEQKEKNESRHYVKRCLIHTHTRMSFQESIINGFLSSCAQWDRHIHAHQAHYPDLSKKNISKIVKKTYVSDRDNTKQKSLEIFTQHTDTSQRKK